MARFDPGRAVEQLHRGDLVRGRWCESSGGCKSLQEVELPSDTWLTRDMTVFPTLLGMVGVRQLSLLLRCSEVTKVGSRVKR
jgi:hypothetical protein